MKIARLHNDGELLIKGEVVEYPLELKGGRNLLSTNFEKYDSGLYAYIELVEEDTEMILKLYDRDSSIDMSGIYFGFTGVGYSAEGNVMWSMNNGNLQRDEIVQSEHRYFSFYPGTEVIFNKIFDRFYIKIEKGNKATPWTPSPEDLGLVYSDDIQNFTTGFRNNGDLLVGEFIEKEFVPPSLSFNNDYLQLPLINSIRSIMMKIKIPTQSTTRLAYVLDARSGLAAGYIGNSVVGGDFVKMYIDGNIAPSVSWENIPKDKWISLYIEAGSNFNDDINIFSRSGSIQGAEGELREVQVWNKALSQEEIITYGEEVSGEEEGLLAYYPVTSTTSDTLIDVVNNYHGQISPRVILTKDNTILKLRSNSLELYGELIENSNLE